MQAHQQEKINCLSNKKRTKRMLFLVRARLERKRLRRPRIRDLLRLREGGRKKRRGRERKLRC